MIAFVIRRLLQSIAVMLTVGLIAFSLFNYVGDPVDWGCDGIDEPIPEPATLALIALGTLGLVARKR